MDSIKQNNFGFWLLILTFVGTVLFPPLSVHASAPKIEVSDVTFVLLAAYTLVLYSNSLINVLFRHKWIFITFIGLVCVASISIVFNGRVSQYRDWFEPLKFLKLIGFFAFVLIYFKESNLRRFMKFTFISVLIFNLLHYFNLFDFNNTIEVFYSPKHHLDFFGLNSIGEPATRRMLGTLGNPNNNAILFLLFLVYFLPKRGAKLGEDHIYVSISAIFVLACQSRTGFLTLVVLLLAYFISQRINWKQIAFYIGSISVGYVLLQLSGNIYLGSLADLTLLESAKRGRFEQWVLIIESMPGKWILGHGVNKAYLEANDIYAESEYMLLLFRYGLLGVLSYLSICWMFFRTSVTNIKSKGGMTILGVLIIMLIPGLTNSPFHVVKLSVLIVFLLGIGLNLIDGKKN
jgi:hypothetical protein